MPASPPSGPGPSGACRRRREEAPVERIPPFFRASRALRIKIPSSALSLAGRQGLPHRPRRRAAPPGPPRAVRSPRFPGPVRRGRHRRECLRRQLPKATKRVQTIRDGFQTHPHRPVRALRNALAGRKIPKGIGAAIPRTPSDGPRRRPRAAV